jgi:hypothetical protein
MTNPEILKLAETCGFDTFVGEKDDETDGDILSVLGRPTLEVCPTNPRKWIQ